MFSNPDLFGRNCIIVFLETPSLFQWFYLKSLEILTSLEIALFFVQLLLYFKLNSSYF